jgi:hypothetical protein
LIRSIGTLNCFTFVTRGSGYIFSPKYLHVDELVIFYEHHGATDDENRWEMHLRVFPWYTMK